MKRLLLFALLASAGTARAQTTAPTITAADMPAAGDSLRLSEAAPMLPSGAPALTQAGANQTWNYAGLTPVSQRVQRYTSFAAAASGLQLLFFSGANRATLAAPQPLPVPAGVTLPVSDAQEFFNLTSSQFYSVGFGATVSGTALPVLYAQNYDVVYALPVTYTSTPTTTFFQSNSLVTASVPGTGYLSRRRQRINRADAWGTLTTPFGTFQTLRVVTSLADHDSVVVGTSPGQGLDLPLVREYKWLANGVHVPLLTVSTTTVGGQEVITSVEYRDVYRRLTPLAARSSALGASLGAYPNPSAAGTALRLTLPVGSGPVAVAATDVVGRTLFSAQYPRAAGELVLDAAALGSYRGVLLLMVTTSQGAATCRVLRQ